MTGLEPQLPWAFVTTSTTRDLNDDLRRALWSAVVTGKQSPVGVDYRGQCYRREVMPFRQHLCANQDRWLACANDVKALLKPILAPGDIAIDAQNRCLGKCALQRFFNALGADSPLQQVRGVALRTGAWYRLARVAVMTQQLQGLPMQGQTHVAVSAFGDPSAALALQSGCKASAIQEHEGLFAVSDPRIDGVQQSRGKAVVECFAAHVDNAQGGHRDAARSMGQSQRVEATTGCVVQCLQRGCCAAQHDGNALILGALDGEVASGIAKTVLLFE